MLTAIREWMVRIGGSLRPGRRDADLEEELRLHLDMAVEDGRRRTGSAADGRRAAAVSAGGVAQAMDMLREQQGLPLLDTAGRDLRHAGRAIARNPGFTTIAVATLGAGLALCLTVLTIINAYMLRPLPYPASDRLYSVVLASPGRDLLRGLENVDWTAADDVIEYRIAWDLDAFYLLGGSHPERALGAWVTPGFVAGLGLRAERGRVLEPADFAAAGPPAVMISHHLWTSRFGGDPAIVGRTFRAYVSDRPDEPETLTVVGVLPPDFWHFNPYTDVLGPLRARSYPYLVRLRAGVEPAAAAARVTAIVRATDPSVPEDWRAGLVAMQSRYVAEMRPLVNAVAVAVGLVMLIACANIAVLMSMRAARRRHEMAVRLALGASRVRLVRLLGFEALAIGAMATTLGVAATALLTHGLAPTLEQRLGRRLPGGQAALALDGTVAAAALAGGLLLALILTLAPLVTVWSTAVMPALKSGGRIATEGRATRRLRFMLIGGEIAAALALLVGSALLVRSAISMLHLDPGFRAAGVLATSVGLRPRSYPDAISRAELYTRLLARLHERSGAPSALSDASPLEPVGPTRVERPGEDASAVDAGVIAVSASYFDTLGIRFRDGNSFAAQDRVGGEPVAIVSESLARRLWPATRAVGQRLRVANAGSGDVSHLVVGVVEDMRRVIYDDGRVQADGSRYDAYVPLAQNAGRFANVYSRGFSTTPESLRTAIAEVDSEAAVAAPETLASALEAGRSGPRYLASVLSAFAAFAALLAVLGVYSVIAYGVRQREREIGIRLLVGAEPRAVSRLFVREGGPLVASGLAAGLFGAVGLGRALRSQLFEVEPVDPGTLAATTALFAICAWLALWWPARRAARVDPAHVLKDE
jgi:predicted permease